MRGFGALFNGHSASWWSDKHNLHHARTNHVGMDEDIIAQLVTKGPTPTTMHGWPLELLPGPSVRTRPPLPTRPTGLPADLSMGSALLFMSLRALKKAFTLLISLTSKLQLQLGLAIRLVYVSQQALMWLSPRARRGTSLQAREPNCYG